MLSSWYGYDCLLASQQTQSPLYILKCCLLSFMLTERWLGRIGDKRNDWSDSKHCHHVRVQPLLSCPSSQLSLLTHPSVQRHHRGWGCYYGDDGECSARSHPTCQRHRFFCSNRLIPFNCIYFNCIYFCYTYERKVKFSCVFNFSLGVVHL